jgi:hypothetical protein
MMGQRVELDWWPVLVESKKEKESEESCHFMMAGLAWRSPADQSGFERLKRR